MARFRKSDTGRNPQLKSGRAQVNTYYRSESRSKRSPFVKKQPKRQVRKFFFGFLDIIILGLLLLALLYSLALKDNPIIDANDFSFHPKAAYAAAGRVEFSKFKNRNKLTFDEAAVAKAMEARFPEISSVQVELPFFSEKPVLHLAISKPSFVLNSQGNTMIVDTAGTAVSPTASLKLKSLPVVSDESGFTAKAGTQVMSTDSVDFINNLLAQCRRAKVPVASLALPSSPQELLLRTKDTGYYVKFYLGGDALQETGQFLAARRHFLQIHQPPTQYLDVRVSGKIYYK